LRTIRVILHGVVFSGINIGAILLGYGAYHVVKPVSQLVIQVPTAVVASFVGFQLWDI
jgi:hypothetical protein